MTVVDGEIIPQVVFPAHRSRWRLIVKEVAAKHGVTVEDLVGRSRVPAIVAARHEAMFRVRKETTHSLPHIGRLFGGRDHSTVLNAMRRHAERIAA